MAVSLVCWAALWLYGCQSDVRLCGHVAVSLICWAALWPHCKNKGVMVTPILVLNGCARTTPPLV